MKLCLVVFMAILDISASLKCYSCFGYNHPSCISLESYKMDKERITECDECFVQLGDYGLVFPYATEPRKTILIRGCQNDTLCVNETYINCCRCTYDYCNQNNECKGSASSLLATVTVLVACLFVAVQQMQ